MAYRFDHPEKLRKLNKKKDKQTQKHACEETQAWPVQLGRWYCVHYVVFKHLSGVIQKNEESACAFILGNIEKEMTNRVKAICT